MIRLLKLKNNARKSTFRQQKLTFTNCFAHYLNVLSKKLHCVEKQKQPHGMNTIIEEVIKSKAQQLDQFIVGSLINGKIAYEKKFHDEHHSVMVKQCKSNDHNAAHSGTFDQHHSPRDTLAIELE